jgi:hypothetical protein
VTPVRQDKLFVPDGIGNGNCFAAALASLLDLPLWMVPPFDQMFGRGGGVWHDRCDEWLKRMFRLELVTTPGHHPDHLPEFYLGNGMSPRGVMHSTVWSRGKMVHDPHLSDGGIVSVEYTYHLAQVATP